MHHFWRVIQLLLVYFLTRPKTVSGSKSFTLTVVDDNGNEKKYSSKTDQKYLYGALLEIVDLNLEGEEHALDNWHVFLLSIISRAEGSMSFGSYSLKSLPQSKRFTQNNLHYPKD